MVAHPMSPWGACLGNFLPDVNRQSCGRSSAERAVGFSALGASASTALALVQLYAVDPFVETWPCESVHETAAL